MSIRERVRALAAYEFTARPAAVKLDQNEAPDDLPEPLRSRALALLADLDLHRYPEMHAETLRARLARLHAWPERGVVVANGSNVLIQALCIVAGLGQRVLTVTPTFSVYALQARLLGIDLTEVPLGDGFSLPRAALERELERGTGVLFLADPAAPSGNRHPEAEVRALVRRAAELGWTVVLDEAYWQFSGRDHAHLLRATPGTLSLRTLSKAFGLAGVRLGYALAAPELARELQKALLPFAVSAPQSALAVAVLDALHEDPSWLDARLERTRAERARLQAALAEEPGVEAFPSDTNFVLFRVADAAAVYHELLERGVLVRRQDHLPLLHGCLRVTVASVDDNDRFLEALRGALAGVRVHA